MFWKEGNAGWTKAAEIPELADVHKAVQAFQQQHPGHHAVSGYVLQLFTADPPSLTAAAGFSSHTHVSCYLVHPC